MQESALFIIPVLVCTCCVQAMEERDRLQQQLQQLSNLQQQLSGLQQQLEAVTCAAAESAVSAAEFQEKFIRERAVRRRLHEQLQVRAATHTSLLHHAQHAVFFFTCGVKLSLHVTPAVAPVTSFIRGLQRGALKGQRSCLGWSGLCLNGP